MIKKFKYLLFYFLAAFAKPIQAVQRAIASHEEVLKVKITLSDRTEEKRAAMREWVKPENVAARLAENEKWAKESLAHLSERDLPPPIPPLDELPPEMRNQQPSMIRTMLKAEGKKFDWDQRKWV